MTGEQHIIQLLVIDDSSNDTEAVANLLRNGGHAVHAERIEDDEDLRRAIAERKCDMVLSKPTIPFFSAMMALDVIRVAEADLPLLLIADDANLEQINQILDAGARDAVRLSNSARLVHAILREVEDLHQRRQHRACQQRLAEANERAQSLVNSSRDAIAYVHEGMHIYANESYLMLFGYTDIIELEGMPVMDMVAAKEQGALKEFLRDYAKSGTQANTIHTHGVKSDRTVFEMAMEFAPASYESEPCTQIMIRDQSLSRELEKKLDDLAKQDLLTGVFNRQYFLEALQREVGKPKRWGAVLYVKPDNFKELRQRVGIASSDMVLADIAAILNSRLTEDADFVARFETTVFAVLLHGAGVEEAEAMAVRMRDAVAAHVVDADGNSVSTTCSVGITLYNQAIKHPNEVVTRAERAFAQATERGFSQIAIYSPADEEMVDRERLIAWEKRLKHALRSNSFRLLYQPMISLHGDQQENYEVLLRMLDDEGNEIPPHEFMPIAEQSGLMLAIDRWVLANATKVLSERQRSGKTTNFFIKLSAASLSDCTRLLPWMRELLKAARLEQNVLVVEVSEKVAGNHIKALNVLLDGLRQLRVRLALDHVGLATNFANLLKHCDADYIKVDGTIIGAITRDSAAREKLQLIAAQAKEGDKKVIAEFVEDAQTMATLWTSGIDLIQGHFLQPPMAELTFDFSSAG